MGRAKTGAGKGGAEGESNNKPEGIAIKSVEKSDRRREQK